MQRLTRLWPKPDIEQFLLIDINDAEESSLIRSIVLTNFTTNLSSTHCTRTYLKKLCWTTEMQNMLSMLEVSMTRKTATIRLFQISTGQVCNSQMMVWDMMVSTNVVPGRDRPQTWQRPMILLSFNISQELTDSAHLGAEWVLWLVLQRPQLQLIMTHSRSLQTSLSWMNRNASLVFRMQNPPILRHHLGVQLMETDQPVEISHWAAITDTCSQNLTILQDQPEWVINLAAQQTQLRTICSYQDL